MLTVSPIPDINYLHNVLLTALILFKGLWIICFSLDHYGLKLCAAIGALAVTFGHIPNSLVRVSSLFSD